VWAKHDEQLVAMVRAAARPIAGGIEQDDALLDLVGDARLVLLGEASHGTHEFYAQRAALTQRLVVERGFTAVAAEADWPDAYRVNCFVRGRGDDTSPEAALGNFTRFPRWMWRNTVVRDFVSWLKAHNAQLPNGSPQTGFYGLDLYSLHRSLDAVLGYLARVDPAAAQRARERYGCFAHYGDDPQIYGHLVGSGMAEGCEEGVVAQLRDLQHHATELAGRDGQLAADDYFFAEQNARLAKNAEAYYRIMFRGHIESWNVRDQHMAETIDALLAHLDRQGGRARAVVWAHNSHLGDARATERERWEQLNLGQLVRERYGRDAVLIGWSTYSGSVTAADDWDEPPQRFAVRPGLVGSYEALFHAVSTHQATMPAFWLDLRAGSPAVDALQTARLQRAIGVVYRPATERRSHYFHARLPGQFDALIHIDETRALEPLDCSADWQPNDLLKTFASGKSK
jgi:erythromycin esterase-like protein